MIQLKRKNINKNMQNVTRKVYLNLQRSTIMSLFVAVLSKERNVTR